MSDDYSAVVLTKRSDGVYAARAWPIKIGMSLSMLNEPSPVWAATDDLERVEFRVANGRASYKCERIDAFVWVGRLIDMEFEPLDWLQEVG